MTATAHPWWLRLHAWQWLNAWRDRPFAGTAAIAAWSIPSLLLPGALRLVGPAAAGAAMDATLSMDVPLALLLAALTGSTVLALARRPDTEDWLLPARCRGAGGWMLSGLRLLGALRWPTGLAVASLLLSYGIPARRHDLAELLLIAALSLAVGATLAWLLRAAPGRADRTGAIRAPGLAALSWAPLSETRRQLDLRRLSLLATPVLLAAPMGVVLAEVGRMLAIWLPLLYLMGWLREAGRISQLLRRWMPQARLDWWIWRYVLLASGGCCLGLWALWQLVRRGGIAGWP